MISSNKKKILVVDDAPDISEMLRFYFSSQGYEVLVAHRGQDAINLCQKGSPQLVLLDIMLPDMDGYDVCKRLRSNLRTSHIPIIFLTQRDERSDKIAGLELGADDYVTKPFDIEELRMRVQNALKRASYESLTNPVTGLPSGKLVEDVLKRLLRDTRWALLFIGVGGFRAFGDVYGFVAGDDVLRFASSILTSTTDEAGGPNDFVGHVGGADFLVVVDPDRARTVAQKIQERFNREVGSFYSFRDREAGYMTIVGPNGKETHAPLMTMSIGVIFGGGNFADIREITEVAAEARRKATTTTGNLYFAE